MSNDTRPQINLAQDMIQLGLVSDIDHLLEDGIDLYQACMDDILRILGPDSCKTIHSNFEDDILNARRLDSFAIGEISLRKLEMTADVFSPKAKNLVNRKGLETASSFLAASTIRLVGQDPDDLEKLCSFYAVTGQLPAFKILFEHCIKVAHRHYTAGAGLVIQCLKPLGKQPAAQSRIELDGDMLRILMENAGFLTETIENQGLDYLSPEDLMELRKLAGYENVCKLAIEERLWCADLNFVRQMKSVGYVVDPGDFRGLLFISTTMNGNLLEYFLSDDDISARQMMKVFPKTTLLGRQCDGFVDCLHEVFHQPCTPLAQEKSWLFIQWLCHQKGINTITTLDTFMKCAELPETVRQGILNHPLYTEHTLCLDLGL